MTFSLTIDVPRDWQWPAPRRRAVTAYRVPRRSARVHSRRNSSHVSCPRKRASSSGADTILDPRVRGDDKPRDRKRVALGRGGQRRVLAVLQVAEPLPPSRGVKGPLGL